MLVTKKYLNKRAVFFELNTFVFFSPFTIDLNHQLNCMHLSAFFSQRLWPKPKKTHFHKLSMEQPHFFNPQTLSPAPFITIIYPLFPDKWSNAFAIKASNQNRMIRANFAIAIPHPPNASSFIL